MLPSPTPFHCKINLSIATAPFPQKAHTLPCLQCFLQDLVRISINRKPKSIHSEIPSCSWDDNWYLHWGTAPSLPLLLKMTYIYTPLLLKRLRSVLQAYPMLLTPVTSPRQVTSEWAPECQPSSQWHCQEGFRPWMLRGRFPPEPLPNPDLHLGWDPPEALDPALEDIRAHASLKITTCERNI